MTASPTFVLVPGAGATSFLWDPVVTELALRGHRALPVELPGHGFDTVFPPGYDCPQDTAALASAPSPVAELLLRDYVEHTLAIVRRAAEHGPVILVGHSMGGSTVTGVANAAPELLAHIVYVCAYCCVELPSVAEYAPRPADDDILSIARKAVWIGDPRKTGTARTNPRDGGVVTIQHELLMADLDPVLAPAVLNYALQPDESMRVMLADASVDRETWPRIPRTYIRATADRVLPVSVQDRMIGEADALSPAAPFAVHSVDASHFVSLTRAGEVAGILAALS